MNFKANIFLKGVGSQIIEQKLSIYSDIFTCIFMEIYPFLKFVGKVNAYL